MTPNPTHPRIVLACIGLAAVACGGGDPGRLESRFGEVTFDPTPVGRLSQPRVVEWSNPGPDSLALVELRLEGPAPGDFMVEEDLCAGATLPPGGSCSAVVLFGPRDSGTRTASITLVSDVGASATLPLRGEGVSDGAAPIETVGMVRAVPETLDFGAHPIGATGGPLGVRLLNPRGGPVQFAVRLRGGPEGEYRVALDRCSNELLPPGRACTIRILFAPAVEGTRSAELVLRDLNGPSTQIVPLVGTGGVAAAGSAGAATSAPMAVPLVVRPRAIEFGVMAAGSVSEPRAVRIENNSAANVVITSFQLAGDAADAFQILGGNCERRTLVPTRACSIEVVFQPSVPGAHAARIEAATSVGVESTLVVLSGTARAR